TTFFTKTGNLTQLVGFCDPSVVYDDQAHDDQSGIVGRFFVTACTRNDSAGLSYLDIAVSTTNKPQSFGAGDWHFYQVNASASISNPQATQDVQGLQALRNLQTITLSDVTGGTFTLWIPNNSAQVPQTVAYSSDPDIESSNIKAALNALGKYPTV